MADFWRALAVYAASLSSCTGCGGEFHETQLCEVCSGCENCCTCHERDEVEADENPFYDDDPRFYTWHSMRVEERRRAQADWDED